jgi:hypothetical protein
MKESASSSVVSCLDLLTSLLAKGTLDYGTMMSGDEQCKDFCVLANL